MTCFCGCGHAVKGLRTKAANSLGEQLQSLLVVFEGASNAALGELDDPVRSLVADGRANIAILAGLVHGTYDRRNLDKPALQAWNDRAVSMLSDLGQRVTDEGWLGPLMDLTHLVHGGERAPGVVVAIRDTGTTVNTMFRAWVTLEVTPAQGPVRTVTTKVFVPRLAPPRVGDAVEVAYRPDDPEKVAFKSIAPRPVASPPTHAAPDRLDRLQQAAELHASGVLSAAEYEREKRRILDEG